MKTRPFTCPECGKRVMAYVPQFWPEDHDGYYELPSGDKIEMRPNHIWVTPFFHKNNQTGQWCDGGLNRYYVGYLAELLGEDYGGSE